MACYYNFKVLFFVKLLIGDTEREFFYKERKRKREGLTKRERMIILLKRKKIRLFCVTRGHSSSVILNIIKKSGACESSNYTFRSHLRCKPGVIYALITMIWEITSLNYMTNDDSKKTICIKRILRIHPEFNLKYLFLKTLLLHILFLYYQITNISSWLKSPLSFLRK